MVNHLPLLWKDRCTIVVNQKYTKPNGANGFREVALCSDEPCKLSFLDNPRMNGSASVGFNAAEVFQSVKLFIQPMFDIPEGSKVTVVTHQNGKTLHYKSSGTPSVFTNHQEIMLEVDKEWA